MRSLLSISGFAFLFLPCAGSALAEDARALLDRAIEGHGGAARLERTKKGHLKATMEGRLGKSTFQFSFEETFDLPGRYRRTIDNIGTGMPLHLESAFTGKEGWTRRGTGPAQDISVREELPLARHWHAILAQLLLLRDQDIQLTSLPDKTQDGRTLAGIHVTSPHGSDDFYFDKSTGLLARAERAMPTPLGGQFPAGETIFDDFRDIQGVLYPMRFKANVGKPYSATVTLLSIEFCDQIDESVFLKPQTPTADGPAGETVAGQTHSGSSSEDGEKVPVPWDRILIVTAVSSGAIIGTLWLLVHASKRRKRRTPPS